MKQSDSAQIARASALYDNLRDAITEALKAGANKSAVFTAITGIIADALSVDMKSSGLTADQEWQWFIGNLKKAWAAYQASASPPMTLPN